MGKICKYSNLYDKNGKFLHGPGSYTVQECKELVDKLAEEDSNGKAYENAMATLMSMSEVNSTTSVSEVNSTVPRTSKAEVVKALNAITV